MNRSKSVGTAAETAVVRYLRANGWPNAERRALRGTLDAGDVTGTPGIVWEVKAGTAAKTASDGLVQVWMAETEAERVNAGADVGVLVLARAGVGAVNCGRWWAVLPVWQVTRALPGPASGWDGDAPIRLTLDTAAELLRFCGYGEREAAS